MKLFSEFRNKLKVETEEKSVRKYKVSDINTRKDKQTGNLELYTVETISSSKEEGWTIGEFRMRETNIKDSKNKINYTLVVSPSGHFYRRVYDDCGQGKRYSIIYSTCALLQQITGMSMEEAESMLFTKEELIDLIEKINKEKSDAIYWYMNLVQYSENYKGKRFLEGMHVVIASDRSDEEKTSYTYTCVENPSIKVNVKDNGTLVAVKDGEKEQVRRKNFEFVYVGLPDVYPGRRASLDGYTIEAVRKIAEEYKKEKEIEGEEK